MDQALALTPGVPESLRENIVERVEEGSRDYVKKATDPRQQALWTEQARKAGSSAWKLTRGGGGTSRASGHIYRDSVAGGHVNAETGEYSLITSFQSAAPDDTSPSSTSSIHSFFAGPDLNVTTVVTVSSLSGAPDLRAKGFAVNVTSPSEQVPPWPQANAPSANRASTGRDSTLSNTATPPGDPNLISGRDW